MIYGMAKRQDFGKEMQLGTRKVSDMNFSKIVTLPKVFTDNYLDENRTVAVSLSVDGSLILTPVKGDKKPN
jgi:hypothetical protein